jgi:hypothetical protein
MQVEYDSHSNKSHRTPYINFYLNKKRIGFIGSGPAESWIGIFTNDDLASYVVVERFKNRQVKTTAKQWLRDFFEPLPYDDFAKYFESHDPLDFFNKIKEMYHSN